MSKKCAANKKKSAQAGLDKTLLLPQPGPQTLAATCPFDIMLFGGARGGGKSDCAIGRQINGALTYGTHWNGLFIRKNFKHFAELRRRWDELIAAGLPAQRTGGDVQTNTIKFANGAKVLLTAVEREDQLEFFQGQQFTEISIEEGCQFPFFDVMVEKLRGCMRSPAGVPCRMFITANPGGPGHNQVKKLFKIGSVAPGTVLVGKVELPDGRVDYERRIFIPSRVTDNKILCNNDPKYVARLMSIRDPKLRAAWLEGDWEVVAGGFFDHVWDNQRHVLRRFDIPAHWDRIIGFDWGSAKPFSVGWYAISTGEFVPELGYSLPRGAIVRYREWYGCVKDMSNVGLRLDSRSIARKILEINDKFEPSQLFDCIADPHIFKQEDGPSVFEKMADIGVVFRKGDSRRPSGWDECTARLVGRDGRPMFYVTENCENFVKTIPVLSRDLSDFDDIDTDQEDHIADEWRYVMMSRPGEGESLVEERQKSDAELDHDEICAVGPSEDSFGTSFDDGLPTLNAEMAMMAA